MLNLINLLNGYSGGIEDMCDDLAPVLRLVGVVIKGIKIVVPIILIIVGMIDMAKAVTEKSEDKIKDAQNKLIKKAIAAVIVFLVATFVSVIMTLVAADEYKQCMECVDHPFGNECKGLLQDAQ